MVNTELAWEMNKKAFQQHKLHRTPIKLLVRSSWGVVWGGMYLPYHCGHSYFLKMINLLASLSKGTVHVQYYSL